jgi:hypothetical protein
VELWNRAAGRRLSAALVVTVLTVAGLYLGHVAHRRLGWDLLIVQPVMIVLSVLAAFPIRRRLGQPA